MSTCIACGGPTRNGRAISARSEAASFDRVAVERLVKTARLAVGFGVGNLNGPKYHARVAAFDELDDALEALAGDKP